MRHCLFNTLLLLTCYSAMAAENLSDHEQFCQTAPELPCLLYIQKTLSMLPEGSSSWFKTKSYELDYLFDKHQFNELSQQTRQLLTLDTLPDSFAVQLYFYRAKVLYLEDNITQASFYANMAQQKLQGAFTTFGAPLRLIELANLHYSLNELAVADALLNEAEVHFSKSKDPLFWFEWFSNKALIAHANTQLQTAAELRQSALNMALELGHRGKIIVAYGNLARTEQLLQQYPQAYQHYELSLGYMQPGSDDVSQMVHRLRMAEICWQITDYAKAAKHLASINTAFLSQFHLTVYQELVANPELQVHGGGALLLPSTRH
jgi:tetratricopeptide (TPR) repeat protein